MEVKLYEPTASVAELMPAVATIGTDLLNAREKLGWEDVAFAAGLAIKGFMTAVRAANPELELSEEDMRKQLIMILGTAVHRKVSLQFQGHQVGAPKGTVQ